MSGKATIREIDPEGRRVLVRVDFNVPLSKVDGTVTDDTRIRAALPTLRYLVERGAKIVLCSHLGRPDGKVVPALSLRPVALRLEHLLGRPVRFVDDCVGPEVEAAVRDLRAGDLLLLENLRFHPEEEQNDPAFAGRLAALADLYVDDAFGTAHRAHASTEGVTHYLPSVAGLLLERELEFLSRAIGDAQHPYAAIIGGAKISGKIEVLRSLLDRVDRLLIGGGMANTFLKAQGKKIGDSLVEEDQLQTGRDVLQSAAKKGVQVLLPEDAVIADGFRQNAQQRTIDLHSEAVPPGWRIMDIGPATVEAYGNALRDCKTVFWNGPMDVFEFAPFAAGTLNLAQVVGSLDAVTIVGGGDTDAAVEQAGVQKQITHVSTGGGASLEFIEGKRLPGVEALRDAAG
ncbi:MAG: phosphoglycerate kinase [Dehalococcoidia bacterium]